MQKIESLFLSNGYPAKLIKKTKFSVKTRISRPIDKHRPQNHGPTYRHQTDGQTDKQPAPKTADNRLDTTYLSLPYIDDTLSRKINTIVKTSKLPVRIAWQSGQTLAEKLTTSALEKTQCPAGNRKCNCCLAGLQGKCHSKNVVYMITCNLCTNQPSYIGETKRCVRLWFNEHVRDAKNKTKNTPFGEHFTKCHSESKIDHSTFTISILQVCKDMAELKIAESIEIRNHKPVLNIMSSSWALIKPVPYSEI